MKRVIDKLHPTIASYVAVIAYLVFSEFDFTGGWLLRLLAMYLFLHCRYSIYRVADEAKKKRYAAVGVGYFVFFVLGLLGVPWTTRMSLPWLPAGYWLIGHLEFLYVVPSSIYLVVIDEQIEPNQATEPTPPSVTVPAGQEPRRP